MYPEILTTVEKGLSSNRMESSKTNDVEELYNGGFGTRMYFNAVGRDGRISTGFGDGITGGGG